MSSRSLSRVLFPPLMLWRAVIIYLGPGLLQDSSDQTQDAAGHCIVFLFGLAPDGVYPAPAVTGGAVSSYLAVSPLPKEGPYLVPQHLSLWDNHIYSWYQVRSFFRRYLFCGTLLALTGSPRYGPSFPAELGLSSPPRKFSGRSDHPTYLTSITPQKLYLVQKDSLCQSFTNMYNPSVPGTISDGAPFFTSLANTKYAHNFRKEPNRVRASPRS